jgi:hypothetical protein
MSQFEFLRQVCVLFTKHGNISIRWQLYPYSRRTSEATPRRSQEREASDPLTVRSKGDGGCNR